MNRTLPLIVALLVWAVSPVPTSAQRTPNISYILPDIGTTRFGTYVEIIAPRDSTGAFGADRTYLNNAGDAVRVVCDRPADTNTVKIGPINVSWNGRLVATQIFVNPLVTPNSEDWRQLQPQFRIPIKVVVNGVESNIDTFYIVRPWPLGNVSSIPQRVLGEGQLGLRSRRGAMIVDSLYLPAGQEYTFSLQDPDPTTPGNQAYLPVVLISPTVIRGFGTGSAEINVSATGINGGPGGGGGGGEVHNLTVPVTLGSAGGNGYTGGGPGGFNNNSVGFPPNEKQKPGVGSGEDIPKSNSNTRGSASLNKNPGGESTTSFENAGGGTGHPFGKSGDGCSNAQSCTTIGGNGGGSGSREGLRGGGAGYGEPGQSENGFDQGGKVYGNGAIVPLAGGSGGAGGNPDLARPLGSAGGGGGGAISIHANLLSAFNVSARGGTHSRQGVRGGAGSGGGVIVGGRLDNPIPADAITVQVAPGNDSDPNPNTRYLNGGRGRARYDGGVPLNLPVSVGHVTDTLTNSLRTGILRGHGNGSDIQIYIKPENGPWQLGPLVQNYRNGTSGFWRQQITWPGKDTLYYVAVGQIGANPVSGTFTDEPEVVFAQSAWNIVRIYGPPLISGPRNRNLGLYQCPGSTRIDTIWIANRGESPLEISSATLLAANGFRIVAPTVFPDTILPFDSTAYVVEFIPAAGQTGVVTNTLRLVNSDTSAGANPFDIALRIDVQLYKFTYSWRGIQADTLDVGNVCISKPLADLVTVRNVGTSRVTIVGYESADPSNLFASGSTPQSIDGPLGFAAGNIQLLARTTGTHVTPILVRLRECDRPDTIWIRYTGVDPELVLVGTTQFGVIKTGSSASLVVELRNTGAGALSVPALPPLPSGSPFSVASVQPPLPTTLAEGGSVFITYTYQPTSAGPNSEWVQITTDSTSAVCPTTLHWVLGGRASNDNVDVVPTSLAFASVAACDSLVDSVVITNRGTGVLRLRYPAFVSGPDGAVFRLIRQPLNDVDLDPGASATYVVSFNGNSGPNGARFSYLLVRTDDARLPQISVPMSGIRSGASINTPNIVDVGTIALGSTAQRTVQIGNTSGGVLTIPVVRSSAPARTGTSPTSFSLSAGATTNVAITVTANVVGNISDTLRFVVSEPCADTAIVIVRAIGTSSAVSIPSTVHFGVVAQCATATDSVVVVNTQPVALDLIDVALTGADARSFSISNPGVVSNQTLQPGEQRKLLVLFDPRGGTDGLKHATVSVRARIGGAPVTLVTILKGERRTVAASAPDVVSFGVVNLAATATQRITVYNRGAVGIRVTSITLAGSGTGVFALRTNPGAPFTIAPGTSAEVFVEFTPTAQQRFEDTVLVQFDQPCSDVRAIPVSGTGRLNVEVEITLPTATLSPALEDYRMPITAKVVSGSTDIGDGRLSMTITYASQVFAARTLTTGTITRNVVIGGVTELDIVIPSFAATSQESVIGEIVGDMTLGDTVRTNLEIINPVITSNAVTPFVRPRNGELTLDICEEGGARLIRRSGSLAVVALPNPSIDRVTFDVQMYERGVHQLEIVSMQGIPVWSTELRAGVGSTAVSVPLSTDLFPSGTYLVVLKSPTRQRTVMLTILH